MALIRSIATVGGYTMASRVLGFVRDVLIARVLGTGEMADGRPFKDVDELKRLLLKEKDQVTRAMAQRLTTYATGGAPEASDRSELDAIVARVREKNYGLRSLVHEIVQSRLFREK